MNVLMCPVCSEKLKKMENKYICKNNHSFDVSRKGYVNLLMSNASGEKRHGDDKMMVEARRDFLNKGFYKPLADKIFELALERARGFSEFCSGSNAENEMSIFECGCGDCYYLSAVKNGLDKESIKTRLYGCDISKEVLPYGKKRIGDVTLFVASAVRLPIVNRGIDVALSIFAPCDFREISRVLKKYGILIKAIPLENHLIELKEALYDKVYLNRPVVEEYEEFEMMSNDKIEYTFEISDKTDLENLFKMTPYYYKTGVAAQEKLLNTEKMKITASFGIILYRKK